MYHTVNKNCCFWTYISLHRTSSVYKLNTTPVNCVETDDDTKLFYHHMFPLNYSVKLLKKGTGHGYHWLFKRLMCSGNASGDVSVLFYYFQTFKLEVQHCQRVILLYWTTIQTVIHPYKKQDKLASYSIIIKHTVSLIYSLPSIELDDTKSTFFWQLFCEMNADISFKAGNLIHTFFYLSIQKGVALHTYL